MSEHETKARTTECSDTVDECRGTKRHAVDEKVKSANEWERADLGDEGRKSKFLRLMGASKKEHHGRFVIGEKQSSIHGRTNEETEKLNTELEDQYRQGLEMKISGGARRHTGLGFSEGDDGIAKNDDEKTPEIPRTSSEVSVDVNESRDSDSFVPLASVSTDDAVTVADGNTETAEGNRKQDDGGKNNGNAVGSDTNAKTALGGFVHGSSS
jgi:hypothetical protein